MKYDTNWFIKRIKEKRPKDYFKYEVLGIYRSAHQKIKMKHLDCGRAFYITPNSFLNGRNCPTCALKNSADKQRRTSEEVQNKLPPYLILKSDYLGAHKPITVYCTRCKSTYKVEANSAIRRQCCTHCKNYYKRNTSIFKKEMYTLVGNEYTLCSPYEKANDKVKIKHNLCGTVYSVTPHNFKHGKRCPHCATSKGEIIVAKVLKSLSLAYIPQKKFSSLVDKEKLSYDFYLPDHNLLIEYQGIQHYEPVKHFGGQSIFLRQQKHDKMKQDFAYAQDIKLLKIPYYVTEEEAIKKLILLNL